MKKQALLLFAFLITFQNFLISQSKEELEIIQKIKIIDSRIPVSISNKNSIRPELKRYKRLSRKTRKNTQLAAVTNALIGKALSDKKYHNEGFKFLKKAYKYRKKQNKFHPQRWILKALIDNGMARNDYSSVEKYSMVWINLVAKFPDQIKDIYEFQYEGRNYFEEEMERLLLTIHPEVWRKSERNRYQSWSKRRETVHFILEYYLKNFPKNRNHTLSISKFFYQRIIHEYLNDDKNFEQANYWMNKSKIMLSKNVSKKDYSDYLKFLATQFRYEDYPYTAGTKTTKYEYIGIELIHEFIKICEGIKRYDQVLFGYRYIATRYVVLNDYKKAIQNLATAMKYCYLYKMEEEIVKSRGGLHTFLYQIRKSKNKSAINAAKNWKDGYDLSGIPQEKINDFDNIINAADW